MSVAVVTGANRGIGLELCRQLRSQGHEVVATCRAHSDALEALGLRVISGVDVTDSDSIRTLMDALAPKSVDILINNAGRLESSPLGSIDYAAIQRQWEVNALGPLRVTEALLPKLAPRAKVALVSSRMGSIADNSSGGSYGYRMSKAALNAAGKSLAHDLAPLGIAVVILHPGYVRTEMTEGRGSVEPRESADLLLQRIDELTIKSTGRFVHANGEELPW